MILTIAHNAVNAKVSVNGGDAPRDIKLLVQEVLSYRVEGAEFSSAFQSHQWDGRSSFFEFAKGIFPAGFVSLVSAKLRKAGHDVRLARRPFPAPLGPKVPKVDSFPDDPRYDYQMQVVDVLERHGQIIAQVATGGGKSRIAKLAYSRIARPTLFLTTRGILMHQMADAMRELVGANRVGVIGDGSWRAVNGFNVGMIQTFAAKLRAPDPSAGPDAWREHEEISAQVRNLLSKFEFVILEEAHEVSSDSFYEIMRHCVNAHYRLSLTATPFMKDSQEANMRLMACSGPVGIIVSEKMLIERGILAKPYFKFVRLEDPFPEGDLDVKDARGKPAGTRRVKLLKSTPWPKCYELGVSGGVKRNAMVVYEAKRAVEYGLSVITLVQHKKHGARLQQLMTAAGLRATFIYGENNQAERKAAIAALKDGRIDVLIGSTILDVGVDVPAVGMIIIASAGKAEVAMRQRIGRGLREKKNGMPNVAFIVDFDDWQNNHLKDHARQRRFIIEDTPGFAENIVRDFDYAGHGFTRKAA